MVERQLKQVDFAEFRRHLIREEKCSATLEKYLRDVRAFAAYLTGNCVTKEAVLDYKKYLVEQRYAVRSINSMLASLNSLFAYLGWHECKVKFIRQQKQTYCAEERALGMDEYIRLLEAAGKGTQMRLVMQTICGTGIRVSELCFFTVEAVRSGEIRIDCKGKTRTILIPSKLRKYLLKYAQKEGIREGAIFLGRNGRPLSRCTIWAKMKQLCEAAKVKSSKVFPHNLRKLFARTFYKIEKDIAKLADVLGHSNINTTRIYIMTTGEEHRAKIEKLGLVI